VDARSRRRHLTGDARQGSAQRLGATFLQRDIIDANATFGRFNAVATFFSLLMLPGERIVDVLKGLHNMITPGGWLAIAGKMCPSPGSGHIRLPFLGAALRVSGWPRDQLKQVVTGAGVRHRAGGRASVRAADHPRCRRRPNTSCSPETP